jgi:phosphoglycolate phosphatase
MAQRWQAVLFDLDGTLIDSSEAAIRATQQTFIEFSLKAPEEDHIRNLMGIPIEISFEMLGGENYPREIHKDLLYRFRDLYGPLCDATTRAFPGISNMLKDLGSRKQKVAVVTSKKREVAMHTLVLLGLDKFIDVLIGSNDVGAFKPNPEPALKALEFLKVEPRKAIVIGDAVFDIQMGNSANCETCGVTWGSQSEDMIITAQPTYLVRSVEELKALL